MDKKVLIYLGIAFIVYQAILVKIEEKEEHDRELREEYKAIEIPKEVTENDAYKNPVELPDDFDQVPTQSDRDYINIFENKITPLNYMYRSNDDVDKKNIYANQYTFQKFINVNGFGNENNNEIYALDEHEQDNFSYIPKQQVLMYNEEL